MRYSIVETDFGDDETKNFGKRNEFASLTSLYEIKTLATVSGEEDECYPFRLLSFYTAISWSF